MFSFSKDLTTERTKIIEENLFKNLCGLRDLRGEKFALRKFFLYYI